MYQYLYLEYISKVSYPALATGYKAKATALNAKAEAEA